MKINFYKTQKRKIFTFSFLCFIFFVLKFKFVNVYFLKLKFFYDKIIIDFKTKNK